jgi:RNA polymerase sigma-70 factor, ECF subfamily
MVSNRTYMAVKKKINNPVVPPCALEEKQWVRKVRENGDRAAFEMLFRTYYKQLHGFAYTYVERKECAEDIVQSIFLKIWMNRETWDPPGTVKHYLFAAVRNEALNELRHRKVESDAEEELLHTFGELKRQKSVEDNPELEVLRKAIQNGIDRLPSRCRQIYLLNRRSGLTYIEIADHLDISLNTVTTQMGRALKMLRKNLAEYLPMFVIFSIITCLLWFFCCRHFFHFNSCSTRRFIYLAEQRPYSNARVRGLLSFF